MKKFKDCLSSIRGLFSVVCTHRDKTECRHGAVNAAILHKAENPKDEVKICWGESNTSTFYHAQAKYRKPGGEWVFLRIPRSFTNRGSKQDNFTIKGEFTIKWWLENFLGVVEEEKKMIIDEEKFDGGWYDFDGETKFNIIPFDFSILNLADDISEALKYKFMYCLVGWEGLIDKKGNTFKYTENNKELLYNYYNTVREFVLNKSDINGKED